MGKTLLLTVVLVPVLLGLLAARSRRRPVGLGMLLLLLLVFNVAYMFLLYYLRGTWL